MLTGVDMTSYGRDLPGEMTLGKLVAKVLKLVPELERLRLSSIDQVEADEHPDARDRRRAAAHAASASFHAVRRRHDPEAHEAPPPRAPTPSAFATRRGACAPTSYSAPISSPGFPTETDDMFANTERIVEDCGLTYLHVFPFSPRNGTPAARMPQVPRPESRSARPGCAPRASAVLAAFLGQHTGRDVEVLIENNGVGRTPHFAEMNMPAAVTVGTIRRVRVTGHDGRRLKGEVIA